MKKITITTLFYILVTLISNLYSSDITPITTSTSFSQDLSSLSPSVEVVTSKEIQLMGVESVPELINLVSGILVNRVNGATANVYMRGFLPELKLNPLILVDGMEITENYYSRTYFYNIPVTIDDIDRVEIIKTTGSNSNGYIEPAGIINIVTRHPQFLDNNYISATGGSRDFNKLNFSINGYNLGSYWKLTGRFRSVDEFNRDRRIDKSKLINLSVEKYINNSKFFIKTGISDGDLNFLESYPVGINHKMYSLKMYEEFNNFKIKNFLLNYKYPHIDSSFYYQDTTGYVAIRLIDKIENAKFVNEFYKFSFRYSKNNFLTGIDAKYYHIFVRDLTSCNDYDIAPFVSQSLRFFKNFKFSLTIRNNFIKNNGSNFNYKFNLSYISDDKTFEINTGYSKSIKPPSMYAKYTSYSATIPVENIDFPIKVQLIANLHNNRHLKPVKIYTTDLSISKKWNNFIFKTTLFYNRITDTITTNGFFQFTFPLHIDFYNINLIDYAVHGLESSFKYIPTKHFNIFASYLIQKMKNKTFNSSNTYYLPKYKLAGGLIFDYPELSGSLTTTYLPAIKAFTGESSDYYLSINATIIKNFFHNKLQVSLHGENLFNNVHKEAYFGEDIGRLVYLKIKYNF